MFENSFLFDGKRIKQGKNRVKKKTRAEGKGPTGVLGRKLDFAGLFK